MTQFFDDGYVGLSAESLVQVVRLLSEPAEEGKPSFVASGVLMKLSDTVCKLLGFSGRMSIRHQALLVRALHESGYKVLYVERANDGVVGFGELITEGDFAGCTRVDLVEAVARARRRYEALTP